MRRRVWARAADWAGVRTEPSAPAEQPAALRAAEHGGGDGRGQPIAAQLPEQIGGFALGDQFRLELGDRRQHCVQFENAHAALSCALSGQALLVVSLQQAPAACVVADHLQNRPTVVVHELLVGQGAGQQAHRLLELDAALLQAPLAEGVAVHQVLTKHAGGPDAELSGAGRTHAVADGDDGVDSYVCLPRKPPYHSRLFDARRSAGRHRSGWQ